MSVTLGTVLHTYKHAYPSAGSILTNFHLNIFFTAQKLTKLYKYMSSSLGSKLKFKPHNGGDHFWEKEKQTPAWCSVDLSSWQEQIIQSKGWVSIDRGVVAALPSTTPRPVHKSSTDDSGPPLC